MTSRKKTQGKKPESQPLGVDVDFVRELVSKSLTGPNGKRNAAFLAKMIEEDKADPSVYRINMCKFSSHTFRRAIITLLRDVILKEVPVTHFSYDEAFITISFGSMAAVKAFAQFCPLASAGESFEFLEHKRNMKTRKWQLVRKNPVLWGED